MDLMFPMVNLNFGNGQKGWKMIVIAKARGDVREKIGILQVYYAKKEIMIIKHPEFEEGDTHHISMLNHLIKSMERD